VRRSRGMGNGPEVALRGVTEVMASSGAFDPQSYGLPDRAIQLLTMTFAVFESRLSVGAFG